MFRHQGKTRSLKHNLRIASILSFVAGVVNVTGFVAMQRLTTNVTGHFAYFINDVFQLEWQKGTVYFLYIFSFFAGAFTSSFIIELAARRRKYNIYFLPTLLESMLLMAVAIFGSYLLPTRPDIIACLLLFAMGLQNSFVTRISDAVVRTTHLTGLFTDLGIEMSQLFFPQDPKKRRRLYATIKLRMTIIANFFLGGIMGALLYARIGLWVLSLASIFLFGGLIFDNVRYIILVRLRKAKRDKINRTTSQPVLPK